MEAAEVDLPALEIDKAFSFLGCFAFKNVLVKRWRGWAGSVFLRETNLWSCAASSSVTVGFSRASKKSSPHKESTQGKREYRRTAVEKFHCAEMVKSLARILWPHEFPGGQSFSPKVLEGYVVMIVTLEPYQEFKAADFS